MSASRIMDGFRDFFGLLDMAIYSLISVVYQIFEKLINVSVFSSSDLKEFSLRIYTFLGIIMLFKVTFSLISYLVNPDTLSDKTTGTNGLIKNVIVVFVLIILVPYAFDFLYRAQSAIINDHIIEQFVLGSNSSDNQFVFSMNESICGDKKIENISSGDFLALSTFRPFYQVYEEINEVNGSFWGGVGSINPNVTLSDLEINLYCNSTKVSHLLMKPLRNAETAVLNLGYYKINYQFVLSTIAGGVILFLLIGFCMDIAMRSIKLGFLELIAPLPIISYIDPKSGKDGMFKKWTKEVFSTWALLFIRIFLLNLAIYILQIINNNARIIADENGFWIMLFILIGALMFAKQVPKLIEDIFGIKTSGVILNPLKKITEQAAGGKQIDAFRKAALGGAVGTIAGGIAGYKAGSEVGARGKGTLVGALNGFSTGRTNPKGAFGKSLNQTYKTMTGNEMSKISLTKAILGKEAGKKSVGEMKDELKVAYEFIRQKQSELNIIANATAEKGAILSHANIDLHNLGGANEVISRNNERLINEQDEIVKNLKKIQDSLDSYNNAKQFLKDYEDYKVPMNAETDAKFDASKALIEKFERNNNQLLNETQNSLNVETQRFDKKKIEIERNKHLIEDVEEYRKLKKKDIEIRSEISEAERDVETFKGEKSEREHFYQQGPNPQKSVGEASNRNDKRKTYNEQHKVKTEE